MSGHKNKRAETPLPDDGRKEERVGLVEPASVRARAVYAHFAETTTFGGVIHTHLSPHWAWKTVWVLIVLALFGATCWNCALVVLDYWTYPVETTVTVAYQPSVPFPTVTVCNRNPVPCLKLAFAYIRHPEELGELMYHSNCWDSVTWAPLVHRLLVRNSTDDVTILKWRNESIEKIKVCVDEDKLEALAVRDTGKCRSFLDESEGATENDLSTLLSILTEKCEAWLQWILFRDMVVRRKNEGGGVPIPDVPDFEPASSQEAPDRTNVSSSAQTTPLSPAGTELTGRNPGKPGQSRPDLSWSDAPEDVRKAMQLVTELSKLAKDRGNLHILKELQEDFSDLIINCTYFGKSCLSATEFTLDFSPQYGSCFSFNSAFGDYNQTNLESGERLAYLTGSAFGLSLELVLDQENYLPAQAAAGAGVRVTISYPGVRSNPADEGYYVKPHSEADISLKLLKVNRMPEPHESKCWGDWSKTPHKPLLFNLDENTTSELRIYSYSECRQLCNSVLLAQICECVDAQYPWPFLLNGEDVTGRLKVCDLVTNANHSSCRQDILLALQTDPDLCSCNLPCEDNTYAASLSYSEWPSDMFMQEVVVKYAERLKELNNDLAREEAWSEKASKIVARELVKVNVYMQTLNIEQISESAKYDTFQLFSDLGGAMGLYLGFCGITLLEILEFVIIMTLSMLGFNPLAPPRAAGTPAEERERPRSRRYSSARKTSAQRRRMGRSATAWEEPPPGVYLPRDAADRALMFR